MSNRSPQLRLGPRPAMFALWALLAAAFAVQQFAARAVGGGAFDARLLAEDGWLLALWALAIPAIFWSAQRFPLRDPRWRRRAVAHLAAATAFIVAANVAIRLPVFGPSIILVRDTALGLARFYPAALVVYAAILAAAHWATAFQGADSPRVDAVPDSRPAPPPTPRRPDSPPPPQPTPDSPFPVPHSRVVIRHWTQTIFVERDSIDWIEADGNYVVVRAGGRIYKGRGRIGDYEAGLGDGFVRVHRSALVRAAAVEAVEPLGKGDLALRLAGDKRIRVARGRRAALEASLGMVR